MTVLFADVMGSMDLAERTDPERWRVIMDRFFSVLAEAVHRFEGTVDKFTGDGIMALFGAPIAHEDHAPRACYAALEIDRAVGEYAAELRRSDGISLTTRVGINSGEVVVGSIGDEGSMEYTAVGHTVGLAQRMESLAEPGKTYLTEHSARLAAGFLELRDLGVFEVKGSSAPLRVFELAGMGSARGRLDISRERGFSRFVGRSTEISQLEAALKSASDGGGEAIGIVGDAGIGKSRLCHEFAERCRAHGIDVYEAQCQAHGRALPLLPALQMLRAYFGIEPDDSERVARERIAGRLLLLDQSFAEDLGLIFDFLGVPDRERPAPALNPEARQRRLLDLVRRLVQTRGRDGVAVNVIEDLHWIDPASELFLRALVEAVPGTRTLVIANFRPQYSADWMRHSYYRQLPLTPLGPEALDELLSDLLGSDPSLDGLAELVRGRTGGNPFFVEEAVRELVESGALAGERGQYRLVGQIDQIAVPPSVQAVLAARIDRLSEAAKQVLQAAATIGREFGRELLVWILDLPSEELDRALRELIEGEFVYETALYPEPEYEFSHPLTQEVAYGSQLATAKQQTHGRIATGLQRGDPERLDERAALIAQHFERAGDAMQAAGWHGRAAGWAGFNDPAAAREHWVRIRELDPELPRTDEADAVRSAARMMLLSVGWRLGADIAEARQIFTEGVEIATRRGDVPTLALLHGAFGVAEGTCGGSVDEYVRAVEEAQEIRRQIEEPNARVATGTGFMYALWLQGRHEEALDSLEEILDLTENDPQLGAGIVVNNPRAWASAFRAPPLTLLGRFEEARTALSEGMELCRRWDRESLGWAHSFYVNLVRCGADPVGPEVLAHGRQSAEVADELGDGFSRVIAYLWHGVALRLAGQPSEARDALDHALATIDRRGVGRETEASVRAFRAAALGDLGETEEAISQGELAVRLACERGVRIIEPTTRILLAETLIRSGTGAERAKELLDEALGIAAALGHRPDMVAALAAGARLHESGGDPAQRDRDRAEALSIAREIDAVRFIAELESESAAVS